MRCLHGALLARCVACNARRPATALQPFRRRSWRRRVPPPTIGQRQRAGANRRRAGPRDGAVGGGDKSSIWEGDCISVWGRWQVICDCVVCAGEMAGRLCGGADASTTRQSLRSSGRRDYKGCSGMPGASLPASWRCCPYRNVLCCCLRREKSAAACEEKHLLSPAQRSICRSLRTGLPFAVTYLQSARSRRKGLCLPAMRVAANTRGRQLEKGAVAPKGMAEWRCADGSRRRPR